MDLVLSLVQNLFAWTFKCLLLCWCLLSWGLLLHDLLLGSCGFRFLGWQGLCSLNWLAIECSVLGGGALQLFEDGVDDAVLGALDEAELESFEVVQVRSLKEKQGTVSKSRRAFCTIVTHFSLSASTLSPECWRPLLLDVEVFESLLDDACWSCEWEFDDELGQVKVRDWVLLSWNTAQRSIDKDLKLKT